MYIIELIIKFIKGKNYKKLFPDINQEANSDNNTQDCTHFFMPLNDDKDFFACKYCGLVVSKEQLQSLRKL